MFDQERLKRREVLKKLFGDGRVWSRSECAGEGAELIGREKFHEVGEEFDVCDLE